MSRNDMWTAILDSRIEKEADHGNRDQGEEKEAAHYQG